jgi:hypothetical protein
VRKAKGTNLTPIGALAGLECIKKQTGDLLFEIDSNNLLYLPPLICFGNAVFLFSLRGRHVGAHRRRNPFLGVSVIKCGLFLWTCGTAQKSAVRNEQHDRTGKKTCSEC